MIRILGLLGIALGLLGLGLLWGIAWGGLGSAPQAGTPSAQRIPPSIVAAADARQAGVRAALGAGADAKQILFGDLHVHTTFSSDAFLFSLPILQGEGAHPPADACDFARFCAGLDFWSINDHAELLTPAQWSETQEAVRACDAVAGGDEDPDLVSFLGWEWTQAGQTPETHFGHKNVILLGIEEDRVPLRPIGSGKGQLAGAVLGVPLSLRVLLPLREREGRAHYLDFNRFLRVAGRLPDCPEGVPVRELPRDCLESAPTPAQLFEKLDDWGVEALVIPHGTSWGIHAPPGSTLANQLAPGQHDPARQRLLEVYSGHGASELYRPWRAVEEDAAGTPLCPEPSGGFTPCCWRAGELIAERCEDPTAPVCQARVARARQLFAAAAHHPLRFEIVPGSTTEEWGRCGQLDDGFLPAYAYRPGMSAQAALALGGFDGSGAPARFRFGLIGSSDTHTARAGNGYKEMAREQWTDAWGPRSDVLERLTRPQERAAEAVPLEELLETVPPLQSLRPERGASFYYTGGLVAVHAEGRQRRSIFEALRRREAYATSGDRILLWFDAVSPVAAPMGSEIRAAGTPRFRVRAVGALEQLPGCPDPRTRGLSPERLSALCLGECHHPGDRRRRISRIEVVRIRHQRQPDEPLEDLVDDPWRTYACPPDPAGCRVEFEDPEFASLGRETVYYVRALQEPTPAVNGDPLRCERDAAGVCVRTRPCYASGPRDASDDCLARVEERAWSSPIFVAPSAAPRLRSLAASATPGPSLAASATPGPSLAAPGPRPRP